MTCTVSLDRSTFSSNSSTAISVECGLGHSMTKVAPMRYECAECGFTVVIFEGKKQ